MPDRIRLDGRVAVVTGAAGVIGTATIKLLAERGARIVAVDRDEKQLQAAVTDLPASAAAYPITADVTQEDEVADYVRAAMAKFGSIDVFYNNAGIEGDVAPIVRYSLETFRKVIDVNVVGVFLGLKHVLPVMLQQNRGSIINTASIAGQVGGSGPQAYSAAKAAVINLTLNAAAELAPHRIRVNAICPGVIFTPLAAGANRDQLAQIVEAFQPWPDQGAGDDIAGAALWLAGDDSRFVNGEAIRVDGGLVATGTRMNAGVDPHRSWERYAGFAPGTTGEAPQKRRLG